MQFYTSKALSKGYRKYRVGSDQFEHWFTIGPFTFRWFSSK